MEAIHGKNSRPYELGRRRRGGQAKSLKDDVSFSSILVDMYEAAQKKKPRSKKQLAEEFVDRIKSDGSRSSAIARLVKAYTKLLPDLKSRKNREWIRHRAQVDDVQEGRGDIELMNENVVKEALQEAGWPIWDPEDDEE